MSEQITEPNDFELHGQDIQISYSTDSLVGGPQLNCKTQKFDKQFKENEIRILETEIGKLITVTVESPADFPVTVQVEEGWNWHRVTLTLLLPTIHLPLELEVSIQSEGIFTDEIRQGFGAEEPPNPPPVFLVHDIPPKGQLQTYEIVPLVGTARRVDH